MRVNPKAKKNAKRPRWCGGAVGPARSAACARIPCPLFWADPTASDAIRFHPTTSPCAVARTRSRSGRHRQTEDRARGKRRNRTSCSPHNRDQLCVRTLRSPGRHRLSRGFAGALPHAPHGLTAHMGAGRRRWRRHTYAHASTTRGKRSDRRHFMGFGWQRHLGRARPARNVSGA